jgi:LacI family transcriptional regulator
MEPPKSARRSDRVTIREVAEDAGVSTAAVSKVLRDAYGVSESLRARVRASMDKLNYRPLLSARGMRGKTYTLGLIFPDIRNPFFADILTGVHTALERTQYQVMLGVSHEEEALVERMLDRQMDGLLLVGTREDPAKLALLAGEKPLVTIGHHALGNKTFDTVNNNDQLGARLVIKHLYANGFRNVAMLSLTTVTSSIIHERETGYRREMIEQGIGRNINVIRAGQTVREVQLAARRLLEGRDRPDAIFCWTDFIALEVISVATELGLSIPQDLAIVGYDNTVYCDFAQNSLTSIDQSGELLGMQSVRLLIERIGGRSEVEHFVVTPRVVARNSSKPRTA